MSNPILPAGVVTQSFRSVVVSLPHLPNSRGTSGVMAGIERLREETRVAAAQLGFADGQKSGFDAGYQDGLAAGRRQAAEAAAHEARQVGMALADEIGALHARVESTWQEFLAGSEAAMTDRCLDTVRALLEAELQIGRESALNIVRRCLGEMVHATTIKIRVASIDLPYLKKYLHDERVTLVADDSIDAGCVIESTSGTVDGTLETSLRLLESAWDEVQDRAA